MKRLLLTALLLASTLLFAAEAPSEVSLKKTKKGVDYTIQLQKTFKMNHAAPFKFKLLDASGKVIKKITLKEFTKKSDRLFVYHTDGTENAVKWWFVACVHDKNDKITRCKTIAGTKKLTEEKK
ncbi:MAG: hypothetical protein DRO96_03290 [Candidatus Aenigmatarchaeota archaeon]|nr:MAG: hypothetical protein DRO96_03290 [Candidatus Aenigmarchaeota archaeon]